jgi:flagellar hook protein FlgE
MALLSALYSGVSGLSTLGEGMQVIGDNIANVNTVGFKGSRYSFQDLISQTVSTLSGTGQVGRGTGIADIAGRFEQGSFESTGSPTDLAIGGEGFFVVREAAGASLYYTRAGNFRFDKDGYLTNPEGYVVQGWALDSNGNDVGSVTDAQLSSFTSSPSATANTEIIVNLDSDGDDGSSGSDTALSAAWDGQNATPIANSAYEYQTTLKVYDSLGSTHDITVYFDKAATASAYEYIVTCNPSEDTRTVTALSHTGLLARGLIQFSSSSGAMTDIDLSQNNGDGTWTAQAEATDLSNGYFTFDASFISGITATTELDFGARHDGTSWVLKSLTSTMFSRASTTTFQSADGYGAGDLQSVNVDVDGVITGSYSNGQLIPLYRVALAKFVNNQGLMKEGGNLYRETRTSGNPITNRPGSSGLGSIAPNSLEQSNVDMASEFVKMISTQRGFQANSKIISVTDQMLAELINLKR